MPTSSLPTSLLFIYSLWLDGLKVTFAASGAHSDLDGGNFSDILKINKFLLIFKAVLWNIILQCFTCWRHWTETGNWQLIHFWVKVNKSRIVSGRGWFIFTTLNEMTENKVTRASACSLFWLVAWQKSMNMSLLVILLDWISASCVITLWTPRTHFTFHH